MGFFRINLVLLVLFSGVSAFALDGIYISEENFAEEGFYDKNIEVDPEHHSVYYRGVTAKIIRGEFCVAKKKCYRISNTTNSALDVIGPDGGKQRLYRVKNVSWKKYSGIFHGRWSFDNCNKDKWYLTANGVSDVQIPIDGELYKYKADFVVNNGEFSEKGLDMEGGKVNESGVLYYIEGLDMLIYELKTTMVDNKIEPVTENNVFYYKRCK